MGGDARDNGLATAPVEDGDDGDNGDSNGVETFVQGPCVQGDSCPRRRLSKGHLSKETLVRGDISPRRQLSKETFVQGSVY